MQGLREAQALLDEGVLSQEEFNTEKAELGKERDKRKKAAEGGVPPPPSSLPTGVQQHLSQVEQLIRPLKRNSADHDGVGGIAQDKKKKARAPEHPCEHGKRKDRCKVSFVCPAKDPAPQPLLPAPCILQHSTWTLNCVPVTWSACLSTLYTVSAFEHPLHRACALGGKPTGLWRRRIVRARPATVPL